MAASASLAAYKVLFSVLGCSMMGTLLYTLITDGSPFRSEILTPWLSATLVDFYVNVVAIVVWVVYKEAKWISAVLWVILLVCFGSIATCAYIVKKLFDVSSQGPVQDPVKRLLLRSDSNRKVNCPSVMRGRIIFSVLGALQMTVIIYTLLTDGFPFRKELLTPWMAATLIDFYINVAAIAVWLGHKESTWLGAFVWICLLICFGSITTCAYIVIQLFQLSYEDPMYYILLDTDSKHSRTPSK